MKYKLGKREPSCRQSVSFGDFLTSLPSFPLVDAAPTFNYPMDFNDSWGDCCVAGYDHFRQITTGLLTGTQINLTEAQILTFYQTQNPGFNPNHPGVNDNGMCIQTFLEYLQQNKYIIGFGKIDYTNPAEVQAAIYIGLALIGGVQLQQAQETQFAQKQLWNPVAGSPILGGHAITPCGYFSQTGNYSLITWGAIQNFTQAFLTQCFDELWFIVTPEHICHPNFRDNFNLAGFIQAVDEITNNQINIPMTPTVNIKRGVDNGVETLGTLTYGTFTCDTLERPNKGNLPNISCVPTGTYTCQWEYMTDLKEYHYELQGVHGRSGIFIHELNYYTQSCGCIGLGNSLGDINNDGQTDILNSKVTLAQFEALFPNHENFTLVIQ